MNRIILFFLTVFVLFNITVQAENNDPNDIDSGIMGEWITVDFVKKISLFDPARLSWKGELSLKGLSFEDDSVVWWFFKDNYRRKLTWESGKAQTTFDRPALYQLKNIGGDEYLFFEWISGDVINRGMKPSCYVLKKGDIKSKYQDISPQGGSSQSGSGGFKTVKPVDKVDHYDDVRYKDMSNMPMLKNDLVRSLRFNQDTIWPQQAVGNKTIDWFADKILNSAKNPGLGIRKLHKMGITGKDVNVAIIDQPMYLDHPEFKNKITAYHDVGCGSNSSMHGPAVASLLVGENCGTAPEARLFYVAAPSWKKDSEYYAKAMMWIVEQNRQLPLGQKIRVVSVSACPSGPGSPFDKNNQMWDRACQKAEAEGIMILDCTNSHRGFIAPAHFSDNKTESPISCTPGFPKYPRQNSFEEASVFVPTCPRTSAEEYDEGKCTYAYWGEGGLSWAIPYAAGVLAMGWQIWPEATPDQMKELLLKSAYTNKDGAKIINPPRFINYVKKARKDISIL